MLGIPQEAKDWIYNKTRELTHLMLKCGVNIQAVSMSWQAEYACICWRGLTELMTEYGATVNMKEGETAIRIDSGNSFYWSCKEPYLIEALILAYETVLEHKPRKRVGHG